ncbi:MAG: type IV pili methyl-accepting chemotaxis transducer N-terminal domain-containing protein [Gammaproteobacteria bacterium]|nr:type IV pili methyl-accepting chemotaxis transducer N-terminal domain-containing protein [Gammaproteobacteria bacterium]
MAKMFERSLLLRLGLAMATITALAFLGMLSSVFIAETTQGVASAVNQAGSLRMQSYRIATDLVYAGDMDPEAYWRATEALVREFESRLDSPRLVSVIPDDPAHRLNAAYRLVSRKWERLIKPILNVYVGVVAPTPNPGWAEGLHGDISAELAEATRHNIRARYLTLVDGFVAQIDRLVGLLEEDAENKIQKLRLFQVVSLFLTVVVVVVTMYLMHTDVLLPLRDLLACAEQLRRGELSARTRYESADELGRLGRAFNVMAQDLSRMYAGLEELVQRKTRDLERSNRSLELLYITSKRLAEPPLTEASFRAVLEDLETLAEVGSGSICLQGHADDSRAFRLTSSRSDESGAICTWPDCALCLGDGTTHTVDVPGAGGRLQRLLSLPIGDQERRYGALLVELPTGEDLQPWRKRLLMTVAGHIGAALTTRQRLHESRRLALYEERGVIARELHDSLAQSLSYLKIQVSRLDMALRQRDDGAVAREVVTELREGVSSAYRQLRELLTTFRLKMDGRGLSQALEETVAEFGDRGAVAIELENRLQGIQLSPNEEIHVLQLVREALSNVSRHAEATRARVSLGADADGRITVVVEDDGRGIPPQPQRRHHYGLAIMEERARSLGGEIRMLPAPGGGTRVELVFKPGRDMDRFHNLHT